MRVILCGALLLSQSPDPRSVGSAAPVGHASDAEPLAPHPSWDTDAPARAGPRVTPAPADPLADPASAPADPVAAPESADADPLAASASADPLAAAELSEAAPSPVLQAPEAAGVVQPQRSVAAERAAAKRKVIGGAISIAFGAVLATSVVALWTYRNEAYARSRTAVFELEQQELVRNARSAHAAGAVMVGVGVALVTLGVGLTSSGVAQRATTRRLTMTPALGRAYAGAGLSVRF